VSAVLPWIWRRHSLRTSLTQARAADLRLLQTIQCKQSTANNPMQTIHCKQFNANNPIVIPSAARDLGFHPERSEGSRLSSRAQPRDLGCHPECNRGILVVIPSAAEGSRFLRRGFDYVREFSPHTLTDGLPLSQKKRRIGRAPGNWGTSRLSPGFPSPGSKLSSRAQPRNLGCHPQRSEGSQLSSRAQRGIPVSWARLRLC
jgi:hypothetical protein